ncbi:hypothetical protein B0H10DRAFT_2262822 [Mycena sp. CBHHK59/15]|nr:hypothetical protein B0H10DRAFT_2262822 [Mycena sp. CBHHK59/15]
MSSTESHVILITGCSTGLGRELALDPRLPREKGAKSLPLDVTSSVEKLTEFAASALAIYGHVDYLVNNAGFVQAGAIEENSMAEAVRQFNTNFFGLVNVTTAFLPSFRQRRSISVQAGDFPPSRHVHILNVLILARRIPYRGPSIRQCGPSGEADRGLSTHPQYDSVMSKLAGSEPGDPVKAAAKIIAFVTEPGRKLPLRFVVGNDAFDRLKAFYTQQLADMEEAKEWSTGTNF